MQPNDELPVTPDEVDDDDDATVMGSDDIVKCTAHEENPLDHIGGPIDHDPFSDYDKRPEGGV